MFRFLCFKKLIAFLLIALTISGVVWSVMMIDDFYDSKSWDPINAIVDDVKITSSTFQSQGVTKYRYRLHVKYHYKISGREYQTGFQSYGNTPSQSESSLRDVMNDKGIVKGAKITVWCKPNDHVVTKLLIEDSSIIMYWVILIFFMLCTYGVWLEHSVLFNL